MTKKSRKQVLLDLQCMLAATLSCTAAY